MPQNYVLLETIELTQTPTSVTFDNIPQTGYTDLKIVGSFRQTTGTFYHYLAFKFNNSTSGYTAKQLNQFAGTVYSEAGPTTYIRIDNNGTTSTANTFGSFEFFIPNYTSSASKSFSIEFGSENNASSVYMGMTAGLWSNSSSISSISITEQEGGVISAGSSFSLYGIAQSGTTPVTAPFASGGNIVANDGTYWYHAFLSSGTFTPLKALTCESLVIAGGGGGGGGFGAGGGAGGVRYSSGLSISTANSVLVGAGGGAGTSSSRGISGFASSIGSIASSVGGGGGGSSTDSNGAGLAGGSGGGASYQYTGTWNIQAVGTGTSGEGNNGGTSSRTGFTDGSGGAGGGGGAGATGGTGSTNTGGAGGVGTNTYSTWATTTTTGVSGYYGGGGGAGAGTTGGTGGSGGGGNGGGGDPSSGTAAIRNTGGGGGGARGGAGNPAAGGSGLVIIRYPMV
jgi:tRNA threonylcarbamoyladenosine modification (KEOPS) complex  Pcc1 subunit